MPWLVSIHSIHFFLEMLEAKEALVTNREADSGLMKCSEKWLPCHVAHAGAELWGLYLQPGSALASGCSSLSPLPLFLDRQPDPICGMQETFRWLNCLQPFL